MHAKYLFFLGGWDKETVEILIKNIFTGQATDFHTKNIIQRSAIEISAEAVLSASQLYSACVRADFKESKKEILKLSCEKLISNHEPIKYIGLDEEKLNILLETEEKERREFFNNEKKYLHSEIFFKNLNIARELLLKGEEVFATILLKETGFKKKEAAQCIKILRHMRIV